MSNCVVYFQDSSGNWIELRGITTVVTLTADGVMRSATIEMNIADERVLQGSEVPPEDCYEEWERMVLRGVR